MSQQETKNILTGGHGMKRVYFTDYKGKKLLYINLSKCSSEEVLEVIANAKKIIQNEPEKSVYTLTDVTDSRFNPELTDAMKNYVAGNKPYVVAAAVVGVTGMKQFIYNTIMKFSGRNIVAFNTIDQAKEWLAKQ